MRQFFQCRHPNSEDDDSVFTCRHQWEARRAEIEGLARQAEAKSNEAKRIPVLADVTLLRSHRAPSATKPGQHSHAISWTHWVVYTQLWMRISETAYPSWAPRILQCLGHVLHHHTQLSLAEFDAFHLRDVISNLDMLTIARTAKLTPPTEKLKADDENIHLKPRKKKR